MKYSNLIIKKHATAAFLLSVCFLLQACENNKTENTVDDRKKVTLPDSLIKHLQVEPVTSTTLVNALTLTGKVSFNDDNVIKIYPLVSGNAQNIKVMLGDYVEQGQPLATIRSS